MAEKDYQYILVERDEHVGIVTLNRPKELNALRTDLRRELVEALEEFDRDDGIGCIVITGAGDRAFAAGADIKEMSDKSPIEMMLGGFATWQRIRNIHKPMIAAVEGYALGGGCELAMHCDMIVASENARFGQPEILIGVMPGAGGTQRLARTLGKYRTMEIVLTGAQVTAEEMHKFGLVNRVVPKGEHLTEAVKLAKTVAAQAPVAVRLAKDAVNAAFETTLGQGLEIESKNFFLLFATEDMREGMQAFIEKRKAEFKGR
jgi:enoyl-CoA hydratase